MTASLIGRDGARYPLDEPRWRGDDGSPLLVEPLPGITRADIETTVRSQWRYAKALPLPLTPVSLGEGCTPLLPVRIDGFELAVKPEWFNPTASFKDRGTTVMISLLSHQRVEAVLEDSSGNGGVSVAAYTAAAGIALLQARPRLAAGLLLATGLTLTLQFMGVLIAAWRAIGEVGEVESAGVIGLLGGAIVLAAGAYAARR